MANSSSEEFGRRHSQPLSRGDQVFRDALAKIESQIRGMWRFRWRAVAAMWVVSILGWIAVYSLPPVYEANARIYVDTENALKPLLRGIASESNVMSEVTVVTREMLSRPNLAEVARSTDLDLRTETDEQFQGLLASLQRRIQVSGNRENIFSISYRDSDREMAVAVVDTLMNTFVEKSLNADRTESTNAQAFLQNQINEYEARLTTAEDRLAKFKRDNVAVMPDQQGDYFTRLQGARSALEITQNKLRLAVERRAELLRQLEGEEPVFGIMSGGKETSGGGTGFAASNIRELELQLEGLRLQYTDKHPRIGQILETIELLKQRQQEERAAAASIVKDQPLASNPLDLNPVYQNMRIQLTNTDVEIASLRAELSQQQREVSEVRNLVDTVPQVEAELGRLNRDYDVVKGKYDQLLAQLETANIGEDVEESIDNVQFRIIEPPFASREPAGPARQFFLIAVLFAALGFGVVLTFLLNLLHPVFFATRTVTATTGLPVLGAVSLLKSPEVLRKQRYSRIRFATAIGLLVLSFTLVSLFAEQLSPELRNVIGMES